MTPEVCEREMRKLAKDPMCLMMLNPEIPRWAVAEIDSLRIQLAASREECRDIGQVAGYRFSLSERLRSENEAMMAERLQVKDDRIDNLKSRVSKIYDCFPHQWLFTFVDQDGDGLRIGMNHSFGYPSITLYTDDAGCGDTSTGVRMRVEDAEMLILALQSVVATAKGFQPFSFVAFVSQ